LPFSANRIWTLIGNNSSVIVLDLLEDFGTSVVLINDDKYDLVSSEKFGIDPLAQTIDIA
jgi:hypothetical protein